MTSEGRTSSGYPLRAVEALFGGALERPAGGPREAWLKNAAGGDEALLAEVNELLAAHQTSGEFLETGALVAMSEPFVPANEALIDAQIGSHLGPYELVELLGEGGFGTVFRAQQIEPVRREVALKVIKLGMDTRQVIARFEAERQALAVLDHACIARVLDAGSTESGRPYFVMDLASGKDLTRFCDEERLSVRERCEVFIDLCEAMQHAHQRGIIHRDLKPSNVLASRAEGKPSGKIVPKVIDFGIAKATGERIAGESMFTELGQIIGTPVYMSPEQATGSADIDTRVDVYSLGVILYELLTGVTPLSTDDLRASSADLAAFLRDFEPTPPSQRVLSNGNEAEAIARARGCGAPSELRNAIKGDLDHIALCALEGERNQRYESAAALARDVQRALENRPIEASPPSTLRRAAKFVRRHRVSVAAATAVVATAIGGAAVAIDSLRSKRDQGIVLQSVLQAANDATAGDAADSAASIEARINRVYGKDAAIVVDALATLADRLNRRGAINESLEARRRALNAAVRIHGDRARETDLARAALGLQLARAGRRVDAAKELEAAVIADAERDTPGTPAFNDGRIQLARLMIGEEKLVRAEELAEAADMIARTEGAEDRRLRTEALETLVLVRTRIGNVRAAQAAWRSLLQAYGEYLPSGSLFLPRKRLECSHWLLSVGAAADAARQASLALRTMDSLADAPADLKLEALRALNQALPDAPRYMSTEATRDSLFREIELAHDTLGADSAAFLESLKFASDLLEQLGEIGKSLEVRCRRFRTIRTNVRNTTDLARMSLLRILSDELGAKADSVCRRDGLEADAYFAAREAVSLALEVNQSDPFLLEAEMILTVRVGNYPALFGMIENFRKVTGLQGEHPLLLALEAIGYAIDPTYLRTAEARLGRALELAKEPQFVALPRLENTLTWARKTLSLAIGDRDLSSAGPAADESAAEAAWSSGEDQDGGR